MRHLAHLQQVKIEPMLTFSQSRHYRCCVSELSRAAQLFHRIVSCGNMRLCGLGHQPPLRVIAWHAVLGDSKEGSICGSRCPIAESAYFVLRSPGLYANKLITTATAAIPVDAANEYLTYG